MPPAKRRMVQTTLLGGRLTDEPAKKQPRTNLVDPVEESHKRNKSDPRLWLSDSEGVSASANDSKTEIDGEANGTATTASVQVEVEEAQLKIEPAASVACSDFSDETFSPYAEADEEWRVGKGEYLFSRLVLAWRLVESFKNTGQGSKRRSSLVLANSYRSLLAHCPKDYVLAIYLTLQKLGPPYLSKETGVGDTTLIKCVSETYGRSEQHVKAEMQKTGDLGLVAHQSKCSMTTLVPPARLSVASVWNGLHKIADSKGASAQAKKREHLKHLLIGAVEDEPKFLIRFLSKQMRMGVRAATVISALSRAILVIRPDKRRPRPLLAQLAAAQTARVSLPLIANDPQQLAPTPVGGELPVLSPRSEPPLSPVHGSQAADDELFSQCIDELKRGVVSPILAQYLSRLGLQDRSHAATEEEINELDEVIRGCYSRFPNLAVIVFYALHALSMNELRDLCQITPGVPVSPMLARPTKSYSSVLDYLLGQDYRAEYKYDGERCQIHIERTIDDNGTLAISVHLFSRNMECLDEKYPDVIEAVKASAICERDAILDSEVVAINTETKKIESFQILSTRKRKDVSSASVTIQVCLFIFDCLRLDGIAVTGIPLLERLDMVQRAIRESENKICYATGKNISASADGGGLEELEMLMAKAVEESTEGLMVKSLTGERSVYEPSQRSVNWLKLKKDYLDGAICDSLDLCVIGAFYGMGKRSGGYGCFLMAVYDQASDIYRSICKVATGFTEQDLETFTKELQVAEIKPKNYDCKLQADVWFQPGTLWEIRAADLSISPVHTACTNISGPAHGKGIGLRFPRFIRPRNDKERTTTPSQIMQFYQEQFAHDPALNLVEEADDLLI